MDPVLRAGQFQPAATFTELVHRMHRAVVFFIRPQYHFTEYELEEAAYDLHHFACALEVTFGHHPVLTSNLHTAICRLYDQCKQRGHTGNEGELWIERSVGVLTRAKGQATPFSVELLLAGRLALDDALMALGRTYGNECVDVTLDLPSFLRDR